VLDHIGTGGTKDDPVLVEEAPVLTSKAATKRQKLTLKVRFCVSLFFFLLRVHLTTVGR